MREIKEEKYLSNCLDKASTNASVILTMTPAPEQSGEKPGYSQANVLCFYICIVPIVRGNVGDMAVHSNKILRGRTAMVDVLNWSRWSKCTWL